MLVIARAYKDRPLKRTMVGEAEGVFFLHNQDASATDGTVDKSGIGFPKSCVFPFVEAVYQNLRAEWESGNSAALTKLWEGLTPVGDVVNA